MWFEWGWDKLSFNLLAIMILLVKFKWLNSQLNLSTFLCFLGFFALVLNFSLLKYIYVYIYISQILIPLLNKNQYNFYLIKLRGKITSSMHKGQKSNKLSLVTSFNEAVVVFKILSFCKLHMSLVRNSLSSGHILLFFFCWVHFEFACGGSFAFLYFL